MSENNRSTLIPIATSTVRNPSVPWRRQARFWCTNLPYKMSTNLVFKQRMILRMLRIFWANTDNRQTQQLWNKNKMFFSLSVMKTCWERQCWVLYYIVEHLIYIEYLIVYIFELLIFCYGFHSSLNIRSNKNDYELFHVIFPLVLHQRSLR